MKKLNRRDFLKLSGAALVVVSLAACSDAPNVPAPPAPSTGKELPLLEAINKVWKDYHAANKVTHEQLVYTTDGVGYLSAQAIVFVEDQTTTFKLTDENRGRVAKAGFFDASDALIKKYGEDSAVRIAGISEPSTEGNMVSLTSPYSCEDADVRKFVDELLNLNTNSPKAEFISIYCPVINGTTYMTALPIKKNKA